ncbi:MAG: TetR/AcrR family transcriptional regulator [Deferrisomatales bacterium]
MAREKLDTQTRQEQIARAALDVVAREGLHGLNIAAVAEEVGIVPSAVYRHVRGRSGVINAALGLIGTALRSNVDAVRTMSCDPMEKLRLLLERHLTLLIENPGIPRLVFSEEILSDPVRRRAMYRSIQSYLGAIEELVRGAQARGHIRSDVDGATVSRMFLGLIQPAVILWQLSEGEFDLMEHGVRAWDVLVDGLAGTRARAAEAP